MAKKKKEKDECTAFDYETTHPKCSNCIWMTIDQLVEMGLVEESFEEDEKVPKADTSRTLEG